RRLNIWAQCAGVGGALTTTLPAADRGQAATYTAYLTVASSSTHSDEEVSVVCSSAKRISPIVPPANGSSPDQRSVVTAAKVAAAVPPSTTSASTMAIWDTPAIAVAAATQRVRFNVKAGRRPSESPATAEQISIPH